MLLILTLSVIRDVRRNIKLVKNPDAPKWAKWIDTIETISIITIVYILIKNYLTYANL